jgi:hypothetical protein
MRKISQPTKHFWRKLNINRLFGISLISIMLGIFLLPQLAFLSTITPDTIINLTNKERSKYGLNTLTANQLLSQAAYNKADAIFKSGKFTHQINNRKFSSWIKDVGYKYSYVGENLAVDFITAEGVIEAWLESETHKKNLLNNQFSEIGIAVVEGEFQGQNTTLVVQIFGAPIIPISAKIPNQTNYSPILVDINPNSIETLNSINSTPTLAPEFTYNLFENSIIQANYLPGFLGQGQRHLLKLISFSSIAVFSQYANTVFSILLFLTLMIYFGILLRHKHISKYYQG